MTAGPSRSRVTRVELTADQLLGSDLTPARSFKPPKHGPKTITVEQLLGTSLTIAPAARNAAASPSRSAPRPAPRPAARSPPLSSVRSSASRSVPIAPNRERVTADEVLRTGLPVRTLQAAKQRARTGQTLILTAEQLLGPTASESSASGSSRSRVRANTELASPGAGPSSRNRSINARDHGSSSAYHVSGSSRSGAAGGSSRVARPSTAGAASSSSSGGGNGALGSGRGRDNRPRQLRRSSSMGSTHTLPIYTNEPGESEVVISRYV